MAWLAYGKSNDLSKRNQSDIVLRDKAFKIEEKSIHLLETLFGV